MLKVLVAPTAYKGSLSPAEVASAIASGVKRADPGADVVLAPVADGGDGTAECLRLALGGSIERLAVVGPTGQAVEAAWLSLEDWAVVELSSASGLAHCQGRKLAPLYAHTYGTGQVILECLKRGHRRIVVAVGGSASTDGGTGALRALGARFLDEAGNELPLGGGALIDLAVCDLTGLNPLIRQAEIAVAADVTNPLLGDRGAAAVFSPQKGAGALEVELLDKALSRLAAILEQATGRCVKDLEGAGAAGGTAFGLACALGAAILPGFEWLSHLIDLDRKIADCDLVITGEGRLDRQSLAGKVVGELARRCWAYNKPLWVLSACAEDGVDWQAHGIARVRAVAAAGREASVEDVAAAAADLLRGIGL